MSSNVYQGGPYVEIFSAQGRDPLGKWSVSGGVSAGGSASVVTKEFDKVKCVLCCCAGIQRIQGASK